VSYLAGRVSAVVVEEEGCSLFWSHFHQGMVQFEVGIGVVSGSIDLGKDETPFLPLACGDPKSSTPDPSLYITHGIASTERLGKCLSERVTGDVGVSRVGQQGSPHLLCVVAVDLFDSVPRRSADLVGSSLLDGSG
jgi:hypothetical protein